MLLESDGLSVLGVDDCQTGLGLIAKHRPNVVLLDLNIKGEIAPTEFVSNALTISPDLKIILVSGSTTIADVARALPVTGFITKPYDVDAMLKLVRSHLPHAFQTK